MIGPFSFRVELFFVFSMASGLSLSLFDDSFSLRFEGRL